MRITQMVQEEIHRMKTLRNLRIFFEPQKCKGVWECYEVCPVDCWLPDHQANKVIFKNAEQCIACGACVLQCPQGAIALK